MAGSPGDLDGRRRHHGRGRLFLRCNVLGDRNTADGPSPRPGALFSGLAAGAETGSPEVSTRYHRWTRFQASGGSPGIGSQRVNCVSSVGRSFNVHRFAPSERTQPAMDDNPSPEPPAVVVAPLRSVVSASGRPFSYCGVCRPLGASRD